MDSETHTPPDVAPSPDAAAATPSTGLTRRAVLKYGLAAAAAAGGGGAILWHLLRGVAHQPAETGVFTADGPDEKLWQLWTQRGWVKEASHYVKVGRNVMCQLCPNCCILAPGDRSHCRNKVNRGGVLYTMAYANPCAVNVDPVEKKPLFHFLPGSRTLSLATSGCVFRCLNCQNWDISQRKPEETKDARGPELRLQPVVSSLRPQDIERLSLFPADAAAMAQALGCPSISYTYSEPIAYFEYARDTAQAARAKGVKNILVTCGSFEQASLRDIGQYVDAAHVDLKGFDEEVYRKLNSGRLQPVLNTLRTMRELGLWVEVVNLVVPTYTDKQEVIRRMCGWLADNLGPDCPLHFSRFMPMHKLTYLPPTPLETLLEARQQALAAGLHYVYVGNVPGTPDVENTFCPNCHKVVVERDAYAVLGVSIEAGRCKFCHTIIPGVWT
ncbi:MAG: AmmeMemoRadiSam system radical SAM enzyme [Phycisphaerae bacterium]